MIEINLHPALAIPLMIAIFIVSLAVLGFIADLLFLVIGVLCMKLAPIVHWLKRMK